MASTRIAAVSLVRSEWGARAFGALVKLCALWLLTCLLAGILAGWLACWIVSLFVCCDQLNKTQWPSDPVLKCAVRFGEGGINMGAYPLQLEVVFAPRVGRAALQRETIVFNEALVNYQCT